MYDLGIIKHHECPCWQMICYMAENVVRDSPFVIYQEFRLVSSCNRKFGDALIWQRIVIVTDIYLSWILCHCKLEIIEMYIVIQKKSGCYSI